MSCCKTYDPCLDGKLNQIGSYASAARQSATSAAASEAAADADAAAAAASATQTNNYLTQVTNIFENFDERYLGSKSVPPTVDNQGNPLQEGAMYWNSVSNGLFIWDGSVWVALPTGFDEFTNFLATGTTFARNLVTREADVVNVRDFGAVGDGVTDDTAAIQAAIITSDFIFIPKGIYFINTNLTIPQNVTFEFVNGAKFLLGAGKTITWNGGIIAGDYQEIFSGDLIQSSFIPNSVIPYTFGIQGNPKIKYSTPFWFGAKADYDPISNIGTDDRIAIVCAQYFGKTTYFPSGSYKIVGNINEKRSNTYMYGAGASSKIYQRDTGPSGTGALINIGGNNGGVGIEYAIIENIWADCDQLTNENMIGIGSDAIGFARKCKVDITGGNSGRAAATMQGNVTECYINLIAEDAVTELSASGRYAASIESTFGTPSTIRSNKIDIVINSSVQNGATIYDAEDCEINFLCKNIIGDPAIGEGTLVRLRGIGRGNKINAIAEEINNRLISSEATHVDFIVNAQCKIVKSDLSSVVYPYQINGINGKVNIIIQDHQDDGSGEINGTGIEANISIKANSNTTLAPIDITGDYCEVRPNVEGTSCTNGVILVRGNGNKVIGGYVKRGTGLKGVRILGTDSQCIGTTVLGDGIEAIRVESSAVRPIVTSNSLIGSSPTIVTIFSGSSSGCIANNTNDTGTSTGKMIRIGNYALWTDATGDLRIINGTPTSDTDGTVVGTQS